MGNTGISVADLKKQIMICHCPPVSTVDWIGILLYARNSCLLTMQE